jgi:two-component system OmpR family response regulator
MPRSPIARSTSTGAGVTAAAQRVLLLDPDPEAANVMALQLRHAGFETHITTSGPSALRAIRTGDFGAIVVVADLTNTECCSYLREIRLSAPRSWLVVIADPMIDRADDFLHELGGDALFAAPFTVAELTQRLSTLSNRIRPTP